MNAYKFDNVLVAIDGSEGANRALDCAISLVERLGGKLTALVVEGKLPAYAATAGEVDEVKKEKDAFFRQVLDAARDRGRVNAASSSQGRARPGPRRRGHQPTTPRRTGTA